jgi:hypothetical protein
VLPFAVFACVNFTAEATNLATVAALHPVMQSQVQWVCAAMQLHRAPSDVGTTFARVILGKRGPLVKCSAVQH